MTDNEIIKAMQCVIGNDVNCSECAYQKTLPFPSCTRMCAKNALDLINRQKAIIEKSEKVEHFADKAIETANAEIERLNIELQSMRNAANSYKMEFCAFSDNLVIKHYYKFIDKFGGREVGILKQTGMLMDGKLHDSVMFELFRDDYLMRRYKVK